MLYRNTKNRVKNSIYSVFIIVPEEGLEPPRHRCQRILSPSRLPIPPFGLKWIHNIQLYWAYRKSIATKKVSELFLHSSFHQFDLPSPRHSFGSIRNANFFINIRQVFANGMNRDAECIGHRFYRQAFGCGNQNIALTAC